MEPHGPNADASAAARTRSQERQRHLAWLGRTLTVLWVATLLLIVGYGAVEGETALAYLDQLELVTTYSLAP